VNEARAQVWLEEGVADVAAELERAFRGFQSVRRSAAVGRSAGDPEDLKAAFADVNDGAANIRRLVAEHVRAVERSA